MFKRGPRGSRIPGAYRPAPLALAFLLGLVWQLSPLPAGAQEQAGAAGQPPVQEDNQAAQNDEAPTGGVEDVNAAGQSPDGSVAETASGQTGGRFIPSEQISLDLGVSFPVDI